MSSIRRVQAIQDFILRLGHKKYDNISGNRKNGASIWNIEWVTVSSFDNLDYCDSYVHVSLVCGILRVSKI